ncbi:MAG: hypothetical protein RIG61_02605 [Deltaproteobacteria bacterium]
MFIRMKSKEGDVCWVNLKQVLVIRLGRPTEGWVWGFSYRNDTLWSETFKTKEEADSWLDETMNKCKIPQASEDD